MGNGSVENISAKGTEVIVEGLLQLNSKIKFKNGHGKVILLMGKNGLFPNITPDQVENGEIIHHHKRKYNPKHKLYSSHDFSRNNIKKA
jgi:hypothetical protein